MLSLIPLLACATEPDCAVHDARLAELEAKLEARDAKLAELEAKLEASTDASAPSHLGLPSTATDRETGEIYPLLSDQSVLGCIHQTLSSIHTAEMAYDAAFDEFIEDFTTLGWSFNKSAGCHRYLAVRVNVSEDSVRMDFVATALVTHGPGRGKRFENRLHTPIQEVDVLDEPAIEEWLAQPGWLGSAR